MFFLLGSIPLHFCFFKFPVSPNLFPSGFIHDLHLEIISVHENKSSAILGKSCACICVYASVLKGTLGCQAVRFRLHRCNSVSAVRMTYMTKLGTNQSLHHSLLKFWCNAFVVKLKSLIQMQS